MSAISVRRAILLVGPSLPSFLLPIDPQMFNNTCKPAPFTPYGVQKGSSLRRSGFCGAVDVMICNHASGGWHHKDKKNTSQERSDPDRTSTSSLDSPTAHRSTRRQVFGSDLEKGHSKSSLYCSFSWINSPCSQITSCNHTGPSWRLEMSRGNDLRLHLKLWHDDHWRTTRVCRKQLILISFKFYDYEFTGELSSVRREKHAPELYAVRVKLQVAPPPAGTL